MTAADKSFILRIVVSVLAGVIVIVVLVLLIGLFSPRVDNNKIFEILTPGFQTVLGGFVAILSGLMSTGHPPPQEKPDAKLGNDPD